MGWAMLATFTLFYLYQLGWSLPSILTFALVAIGAHLLFTGYLATWLLTKFKISSAMMFSNLIRLVYTLGILSLGEPSSGAYVLLFTIAVLGATSSQIYYIAWDAFFTNNQKQGKVGRQMAFIWILSDIVGLLAPLVAGLVAQAWGFKINLVVSSLLLLISTAPLLFLKTAEKIKNRQLERTNLRLANCWQLFKNTPKRALLSSLATDNIFGVMSPLWTLYLAIVIFTEDTYSGLGLISAASAFVSIGASKLAGYFVDKGRPRLVLKSSGLAEIALGLFRPFVGSAPLAFSHDALHQQSSAHSIINCNWYYETSARAAKSKQMLTFFQMYHLAGQVASGLLYLTVLSLLLIFSQHQLDVLVYSCAALGLLGLPIIFYAQQLKPPEK